MLYSIINSSGLCKKQQLIIICDELQSFETPHCFKRRPRTLTELAHWKAHELKNFLLYYGPITLRHLHRKLHVHFATLSTAIRLLLTVPVTDKNIKKSRELIEQFMKMTPQIYGVTSQTHNHHLLCHLPEQVRTILRSHPYPCCHSMKEMTFINNFRLKGLVHCGHFPQ